MLMESTSCLKESRACEWDNKDAGVCKQQCQFRFRTPETCVTKDCAWSTDKGACGAKCPAFLDTTSCGSTGLCDWEKGICRNKCSQEYGDKTSCSADARCMWDANAQSCKKNCVALTSPAECKDEAYMCTYSDRLATCGVKCQQRFGADPVLCATDLTCLYDTTNKVCTQGCSNKIKDAECNADSMCEWNVHAATCGTKCSLVVNATDCAANPLCQVTTSPVGCQKKCEFKNLRPDTCAADATCMWDGTVCKKTGTLLPVAECAVTPSCDYNVAEGCKKTCYARYVTNETCTADPTCAYNIDTNTLRESMQ